MDKLWKGISNNNFSFQCPDITLCSNYYIVLNILSLAEKLTENKNFSNYLGAHKDPLEFLMLLASKYSTVCLPAVGFAGPFWSIRISLANLKSGMYEDIGNNIRRLIFDYENEYKNLK